MAPEQRLSVGHKVKGKVEWDAVGGWEMGTRNWQSWRRDRTKPGPILALGIDDWVGGQKTQGTNGSAGTQQLRWAAKSGLVGLGIFDVILGSGMDASGGNHGQVAVEALISSTGRSLLCFFRLIFARSQHKIWLSRLRPSLSKKGPFGHHTKSNLNNLN